MLPVCNSLPVSMFILLDTGKWKPVHSKMASQNLSRPVSSKDVETEGTRLKVMGVGLSIEWRGQLCYSHAYQSVLTYHSLSSTIHFKKCAGVVLADSVKQLIQ